jgi:S1-C subfamily serine protease
VLLAVGDVVIESAETAATALGSTDVGTPLRLRVLRGGRPRDAEATPVPAYAAAALARTAVGGDPAPQARDLFPAALLDRAGIPPAAQVLSVNGRAVASPAQAERQRRLARGPAPVLLRQGDDRFFVAIAPTP